ncbi:glycosyltransferase [Serratia sp. IR-2025]|uniref:glycosyltransferase n=1 Tax=Serratia marcescens TaxID=615 RepID=UPI00387A5F68
MKVLHAAETIKGGVATVMKQICIDQVDQDGIENVYCIVPDSQRNELYPYNNEIITFKSKKRSILSFFRFFYCFILSVIKFKPDVVHLHSTFAGFLGRVALLIISPIIKPKVIYCPHAFSFVMSSSNTKRKFFGYIEKILAVHTDVIICVSEYEKKCALEQGLANEKLCVIHNGVPAHVDVKINDNPYDNSVLNILFVGRLDYQKGFDILLRAIDIMGELPFTLTVIGNAVHDNVNESEFNGKIRYLGWVEQEKISKFYAFSDVVIMPSRWEGFAMVALESMRFSSPVIASNNSSFPEVIVDGVTGILFDEGDHQALADILMKVNKRDLKIMGNKANKLFLDNFTADKMLRKTHDVYVLLSKEL